MNCELLQVILEGAGYEVALAQDGATALALATSAPPDLILLDLRMPGLSGLEHELVVLAVHRAVRRRREVLAQRQEVADLWARIAEPEGRDQIAE